MTKFLFLGNLLNGLKVYFCKKEVDFFSLNPN